MSRSVLTLPEPSRYAVVEYIRPGIVQFVRPALQFVGVRFTAKDIPIGAVDIVPRGSSFRLMRSCTVGCKGLLTVAETLPATKVVGPLGLPASVVKLSNTYVSTALASFAMYWPVPIVNALSIRLLV
ncbi:hypothetical protein BKK79_37990 (plasmid) [Cupriavidus sp. USMAA2-4]|nr:hypothetical protein BKK79_37990 [Cupriavidus sp. USMAA2-4]